MSSLKEWGAAFRSLRFARDVLDNGATNVLTQPWWEMNELSLKSLALERRLYSTTLDEIIYPERERVIPAPKSEASNV